MQMLIYLFALCESGVKRFADATPAGVLYLQAKLPYVNVKRDLSDTQLDRERCKTMRANGLLIDDPAVLRAMEPDLGGVFIPVSLTQKGGISATSSLATLEQFGRIRRRLQTLLTDMAEQLHAGAVEALPSVGAHHACDYCDYHDICCHQPTDPTREIPQRKTAEALAALETEVDNVGLDT